MSNNQRDCPVTFKLTPEERDRMLTSALEMGMTTSELIRAALYAYIGRPEGAKPYENSSHN